MNFIIVSWPPYGEPICYDALLKMRKINPDCRMIFIGEDYGCCTADDKFFETALQCKEYENELNIINDRFQTFAGIYDKIQIYK